MPPASLTEEDMRLYRERAGVTPVFQNRKTPAPPNLKPTPPTTTPHLWKKRMRCLLQIGLWVMILGGGPNRIGQGIEFDYCCCHASFALQDDGFGTING